jgi:biopolymer transport protein ExbD
MAGSKIFTTTTAAGDVSFNVVPLVDVAFLMILFFILTSTISSNAISELQLPRINESVAMDPTKEGADTPRIPNKIIVNVISAEAQAAGKSGQAADKNGLDPNRPGQAEKYEIDGQPYLIGEVAPLAAYFKKKKKEIEGSGAMAGKDQCFVVIRGDWRVDYKAVEAVLLAAAEAEIPKMNITALLNSGTK